MARRVLVTGASGLVGGNCARGLRECGHAVLGTHRSYPTDDTVPLDLTHDDAHDLAGNADVQAFAPDTIVHCAAYTHVDGSEQDPERSLRENVGATARVVEYAQSVDARVVFISSDYVFDGTAGPYDESATPNPVNVYGRHKLEAEQVVATLGERHHIVRVTNVYGDEARGKNFVARLLAMALAGTSETVRAPTDQYATPINAADIGRAIAAILESPQPGVFHLGSSDYLNRLELAELVLARVPGHQVTLEPITTPELDPPAQRPLQGGLTPLRFRECYPEFAWTNMADYLDVVTAG